MNIYYEADTKKVNVICSCGKTIDFRNKTEDYSYIICECGKRITTQNLRTLRDESNKVIVQAINEIILNAYDIKH